MSVNFTLRLDDDLHGLLLGRGEGEDRSLNWLINDAVRQYVAGEPRSPGRIVKRRGVPVEGPACDHPSSKHTSNGSGLIGCGACGAIRRKDGTWRAANS